MSAEGRKEVIDLICSNRDFRLHIGKNSLTIRVVKYWTRLPKEVVKSPPLKVFKNRLDTQLSGMV